MPAIRNAQSLRPLSRISGKAAAASLLLAFVSTCVLAQSAINDHDRGPSLQRAAVDGGEVEYEVRGRGEPILFIHGALVADAFHPLMNEPALAGYRLINYHRRGYAGSSAEQGPAETYIERHAADAAALLRDLDIDRAHVVGQSSGALIALQLALDSPELVKSLVLLEVPRPASDPPFPAAAAAQLAEAQQANDYDEMLDLFVRYRVGSSDWKTQFEEAVPGSVGQAQRYAPTFFRFEGPGVTAWTLDETKAKHVRQPILYVRGGNSPVPKANADEVRAWFPQTEFDVVPGADHSMHTEAPRRTAEGIVAFLKRHR